MAVKYVKYQNKVKDSKMYGKYYARAAYPRKAVSTDEIAAFIQDNASVTSSDVKAVLDQLGTAMNYFFRRGEKVYLKDIGTFKVTFSSLGENSADDVSAHSIYNPRVLFMPETTHEKDNAVKTRTDGKGVVTKYTGYVSRKRMLDGIEFEETHDNKYVTEAEE